MTARHISTLARLLLCAAALLHLPAASAGSPAGLADFCRTLFLPAVIRGGAAAHVAAPGGEAPPAPSPRAEPVPDLNNDGCADLLVGAPREAYGEASAAGLAYIVPGEVGGLATTGAALWQRSTPGLDYTETPNGQFGFAFAAGDFDGNGYQDLAIGAPGDASGGQVYVLYGTPDGPTAANHQVWNSDNTDTDSGGGLFGTALVAADFNQDGYDDLAIGDPEHDSGVIEDAGAVHVLYGTASGLAAAASQYWHAGEASLPGSAAADGKFGASLAAGDFDGDGYPDLAIGAYFNTAGGVPLAGQVYVLPGSAGRLTAKGAQTWDQTGAVDGEPEGDDRFGWSLVAGDFNGDGYADLAVGVPRETLGGATFAGYAHVLYGSGAGLSAAGTHALHQDLTGMDEMAEAGDNFGYTLAAGDFNADGYTDLAIGAWAETLGSQTSAGLVHVVYGSAAGLDPAGSHKFEQGTGALPDLPFSGDFFGEGLAAADYNHDGYTDLAIGVPFQAAGGISAAGLVYLLFGSATGVSAGAYQEISEASPGLAGEPEIGDGFGQKLK